MMMRALLILLVVLAVPSTQAQSYRRGGPAVGRDRGATEAEPVQPEPSILSVGDPAPGLSIEKWIKGEGFSTFENGKIYVVDFWATWCAPCVASMPHLSELQRQYRDSGVVVLGVTSADRRNTLQAVTSMVAEKGDGMDFTVAWDTDRTTLDSYLKAARQNYIPCVFVVDRQGRLAYIGHPSKVDQPLKELVDGTFDLDSATARYRKELTNQMTAQERARVSRRAWDSFARACEAGDWADALRAYEEGAARDKNFAMNAAVGRDTDNFGKFQILLLRLKDYTGASKFGNEFVEGLGADQPFVLNLIAWTIVNPENGVEQKDLKLAMKAAVRADELTDHRDSAILDTLARVFFYENDLAKAIELQARAVELAREELKAELSATLREYRDAGKK